MLTALVGTTVACGSGALDADASSDAVAVVDGAIADAVPAFDARPHDASADAAPPPKIATKVWERVPPTVAPLLRDLSRTADGVVIVSDSPRPSSLLAVYAPDGERIHELDWREGRPQIRGVQATPLAGGDLAILAEEMGSPLVVLRYTPQLDLVAETPLPGPFSELWTLASRGDSVHTLIYQHPLVGDLERPIDLVTVDPSGAVEVVTVGSWPKLTPFGLSRRAMIATPGGVLLVCVNHYDVELEQDVLEILRIDAETGALLDTLPLSIADRVADASCELIATDVGTVALWRELTPETKYTTVAVLDPEATTIRSGPTRVQTLENREVPMDYVYDGSHVIGIYNAGDGVLLYPVSLDPLSALPRCHLETPPGADIHSFGVALETIGPDVYVGYTSTVDIAPTYLRLQRIAPIEP